MSKLNPKTKAVLDHRPVWTEVPPSLETDFEPGLPGETLRRAFEVKCAETQRLHHRLHRLVDGLPLGAFLYNTQGRVVMVNREAYSILTEIDLKHTKWQISVLWEYLGWPPVPFSCWKWKEGSVTCWDCDLDEPDQSSTLSIRYLKYVPGTGEPELHCSPRMAAIGEKTSRLAHDIRNPLSSIEWLATLLGREDSSLPERRELADHVIQAVRSLDALVSNLLMFSRPPLPLQRQRVNLPALLDEVLVLAMYPLKRKSLVVTRQWESGLEEVTGQEPLLKQALLNLLLNAVHASQPGGRIAIHGRRASSFQERDMAAAGTDGVILSIHDEGCGMSDEEIQHAFQPFYSQRKGGTGLGLPIVQDMIRLHQGKVHIRSRKGKGTTVELFLPQKRRMA